jgi:hypothetical protein
MTVYRTISNISTSRIHRPNDVWSRSLMRARRLFEPRFRRMIGGPASKKRSLRRPDREGMNPVTVWHLDKTEPLLSTNGPCHRTSGDALRMGD